MNGVECTIGTLSSDSDMILVSNSAGERFYTFYLGFTGLFFYPVRQEMNPPVIAKRADVSIIVTATNLDIVDTEKNWFFSLPSLQELK